jgi:hypothetical protein
VAARRDWLDWHRQYDNPASSLSRRLAIVQDRLRQTIDAAPPGPLGLVSMCAGDGRDVIGVLASHALRRDITARLVELHPQLATSARTAAQRAGLTTIEVLEADAGTTDAYLGTVPAHIVMVCGVFGNISPVDIRSTIEELPHLTARHATVIWTRHRRPPDMTHQIRQWFAATGFTELSFDTASPHALGVGMHRLAGPPTPFRKGRRMFRFVGDGADASL